MASIGNEGIGNVILAIGNENRGIENETQRIEMKMKAPDVWPHWKSMHWK